MNNLKISVIALSFLSGCSETGIYTLYRNSVVSSEMRLHVATFDSKDGDKYNSENCSIAAKLFESQNGVTTKFWCERGKFNK